MVETVVVNAQPDIWEMWGYDLQTMLLAIGILLLGMTIGCFWGFILGRSGRSNGSK